MFKIGPITEAIIDEGINELKRKKDKIFADVIDPLMYDISCRYYPHFIVVIVILLLIVILLVTMIVLLVNKKK